MVGPEVDHHLLQLALRERRADDGELLELTGQAPGAQSFRRLVGLVRRRPHHAVGALGLLPLAARALGIEVEPGEIVAAVAQEVEAPLALGETGVVDALGRELLLDPGHHAALRHAVHVAGPRPVGEAVQRVDGGVARGKNLGGKAVRRYCGKRNRACHHQPYRLTAIPPYRLHMPIPTPSPVPS